MEYYWLAQVMAGAACLLALAAFHREAPSVRRRRWFVAFGAALGVTVLVEATLLTIVVHNPGQRILLDWSGVECIAMVVAAIVYLARVRAHTVAPASPWSLALALLALVALTRRAVSLLDFTLVDHPSGGYNVELALAIVEALVVAGVVVPLGVLGIRSLRRLPAAPVPAR